MQWLASFLKQYQALAMKLTAGTLAFALAISAIANPVLDNVAAGQVTIQQTPGSTIVNQNSSQAILNWQSFNIGTGESVHFQQVAGGVALNRISATQGASQIYGALTATGQIILINPAGIYFGPSAYVNVGSLIATTANLSDQDFLNRNYQFFGAGPGAIINQGQLIAADNGLIALLASGVSNEGLIQANLGKVLLASGEAFTLNFQGDNLIGFNIDQKTSSVAKDKNGNDIKTGINNLGSISANGGSVLISAKAASGVLDRMINMEGIVEAKSVAEQDGEIILGGDTDEGIVRVAGTLDASGLATGETGGNVTVLGKYILLDDNTFINTSGDQGAGNIRIGGNYKGQGPLPNATATVMAPTARLLADAITRGNGGEIILWADDATKAYGTISARGGALSGNGGFIETSGKNFLDVDGISVNTLATNGHLGTWLLDPRNVTISTGSTSNGAFNGASPNVFTPIADSSIVNTTTLQNNLATASVTITTGSTGTQNGDITVSNPVTWTSANTLSLQAAGNIAINAAISGINGTLDLQAGALANTISVTAGVDVSNLFITRGSWSQVTASLPSLNVRNNFRINAGTMPNSTASFIRATGGAGSGASPYTITDIYGLQGVGSTSTTLGYSYSLANDIDATGTSTWNSGKGFIPIGSTNTNGSNYAGTFDGQNYVIRNLYINDSSRSYAGLFGATSTAAIIKNIGLDNAYIAARFFVDTVLNSKAIYA